MCEAVLAADATATALGKRAVLLALMGQSQSQSHTRPNESTSDCAKIVNERYSETQYRIYLDRGKWAVLMRDHMGRPHFLGRFDSEDDAIKVLRKVSLHSYFSDIINACTSI